MDEEVPRAKLKQEYVCAGCLDRFYFDPEREVVPMGHTIEVEGDDGHPAHRLCGPIRPRGFVEP